mmetsp:Transcript_8748/g.18844  ORF Transcript_8748/g.18844 Transcript_8748/m.18844 type:complete len:296 (-) Transcript_8748:57-944(-)
MIVFLIMLEIHNPGELIREQTGTANQTTINITHGHKSIDTLGCDTATILNPRRLGHLVIVHFCQDRSDEFVYLVGVFGIAYQSSSNSPDWLVGNHNICHLLLSNSCQILADLHGTNCLGDIQIIFFLRLSNTKNGLHSKFQNLLHLRINIGIGITEKTTTFRVSTKNVLASGTLHHGSGNASREGTLILVIHLLRTHADPLLADDVLHFGDEWEGWEEDDLGAALGIVHGAGFFHAVDEGGESGGEVEGISFGGGIHLPVTSHDGLTLIQLGNSPGAIVVDGEGIGAGERGGEEG